MFLGRFQIGETSTDALVAREVNEGELGIVLAIGSIDAGADFYRDTAAFDEDRLPLLFRSFSESLRRGYACFACIRLYGPKMALKVSNFAKTQ